MQKVLILSVFYHAVWQTTFRDEKYEKIIRWEQLGLKDYTLSDIFHYTIYFETFEVLVSYIL